MIDKKHPDTSVRRQCALLSLNRSSVYYDPRPESDLNDRLMRRLDELYTAHPFLGYRKLTRLLQREGHAVNRKRVLRLMRLLGLQAIYPKPNTSTPHPTHPIYPYLLKNLAITGPNQVWATDITYIRLGRGYCYLVAIIDWYSRHIVSWRLSATMESDFCVEALKDALTRGTPVSGCFLSIMPRRSRRPSDPACRTKNPARLSTSRFLRRAARPYPFCSCVRASVQGAHPPLQSPDPSTS
jgi:putative transposase